MKLLKLSAVLLSAGLLAPLVQAQAPSPSQPLSGTLKKIRDTGTLTLGYRESSIPFSYLDDRQQPIGYAMDLCHKVVDAVKAELKLPKLKVGMQPVTSSNRIPLLRNGTIDLECGSTTNSTVRQKQVAFGPTYFVVNVTAAVKKDSGIDSIADLDGKTIVTTSGTTSVPLIKAYEKSQKVRVKEIYGKDHAESFLLMSSGRAAAFIMDDILLAGQIANSRHSETFRILPEALRQEPYAMMLRKDDPQFKQLVDNSLGAVLKSGEGEKIYDKWFTQPIPPKDINLKFPLSPALRDAFEKPNDRGV